MLTPHEKITAIKILEVAIKQLENTPTTTRCFDCKNYDHLGSCAKWEEKIPDEVIETGCDEWKFDPSSPPF